MTTERALTIASATVLAVTVTALTFAFAFATSTEPRQVVQSPTLADQYTEAWTSLKTEEPSP